MVRSQVIHDLPPSLQLKLLDSMYRKIIIKVPVFRGLQVGRDFAKARRSYPVDDPSPSGLEFKTLELPLTLMLGLASAS